jgi:hypothetical protein
VRLDDVVLGASRRLARAPGEQREAEHGGTDRSTHAPR